jgi:ATP-dependent DNA helicase RecQ
MPAFQGCAGHRFAGHGWWVERANLHYEVLTIEQGTKRQEILSLLRHELADGGGAVIFVSSRKNSEEIAKFLADQGWRCQLWDANKISS